MGTLRDDIANCWRFFFKTPRLEKQIVFYAEYEGSYPCYEGIINELFLKHNRSFCYVTSDPQDAILCEKDPRIRTFCITTLLPLFMAFVNCRVMVMTVAGLNKHDIKRSINEVHYVYVFHASHSCNATYEFGAFEHYDSVLCVGPHQVAELRKQEELYGFKQKELIEAGYYRIERIMESFQKYRAEHPNTMPGKGVILFAPTWEENFVLETCAESIVNSLCAEGYEVILRLHPETVRRYPDWIDAFEESHRNVPGFTLERSISTDESLLRADVLITDWSGITPEYAYGTERPVLFLGDVPQKISNDRYRELGITPMEEILREEVGIIVPVDAVGDISKYVDLILKRRDEFRERILEMRSQFIYELGKSSEIGARHVLKVAGQ